MAGEVIIADTIQVDKVDNLLCNVTAAIMGANDTRSDAKTVTVQWNINDTTENLKTKLITAYSALTPAPEDTLRTTIIAAIGTSIPKTEPNTSANDYIIYANSVTVNQV
jgi:hypothetical protein